MFKTILLFSVLTGIIPAMLGAQSFDVAQFYDFGEALNGLNYYQVGKTIAIVGDVNSDGYDDWAVALAGGVDYYTGAGSGRVNIYFGSADLFDDNPPDVVIWGTGESRILAKDISAAGDVNNDGFDDIIVDNYIIFGGDPMDSEIDLILTGREDDPRFASAVAGSGDVNNDGFDDVLLGSAAVIGSETYRGLVYLYLGGTEMSGEPDMVFEGELDPEWGARGFAHSIACNGDINNDGFDDILVGGQSTVAATGSVFAYFGGPAIDTAPDLLYEGLIGAGIGSVVSYTGDVNGDAYDDFVAGLYISCEAYLFYGGEAPDTDPDLHMAGVANTYYGFAVSGGSDINADGYMDVTISSYDFGLYKYGAVYIYLGGNEMDSIPDGTCLEPVVFDRFGYNLSSDGDLNGDGYGDLLCGSIGDYTSFDFDDDGGHIYICLGGESIPYGPDVTYSPPLSSTGFGRSVAALGDIDQDGYADFMVGAPDIPLNNYKAGKAYVFSGGPESDIVPEKTFSGESPVMDIYFSYRVRNAGDLNGNGYTDIAISELSDIRVYFGGEDMDTIVDLNIDLGSYYTRSLTPAGDVNNDGFNDLLVGAEYRYDTKPDVVWLYLGGPEMDDFPDMEWEGDAINDKFGLYTSGLGDINRDGFDDFMITRKGAAFLYLGGSELPGQPTLEINPGDDRFGHGVTGGQDLNGDGYFDFAVGFKYFIPEENKNLDTIFVYFGGEVIDDEADLVIPVDTVNGLNYSHSVLYATPDLDNDDYPELIVTAYDHMLIYKGGPEMDEIPDHLIFGFYNDIAWFIDPATEEPGIIAGYASDNSAGYIAGRAYIYKYFIEPEDTSDVGTFLGTYFPDDEILEQNRPNPFTANTIINVNLKKDTHILLEVYDIYGKKVAILEKGFYPAGMFEFEFDGSALESGIYFYRLDAGGKVVTRKMVVGK